MSTFITVNPKNDAPLASYPQHSDRELEAAMASATCAHEAWRQTQLSERLERVSAFGERLLGEKARLAALATHEMGKPLAQAIKEVEKSATACSYYAKEAPRMLASEPVEVQGSRAYIAYESIGPILCIMPWNFPYWQVTRFAIPALAVGNTVLLKHAENTTGVALAIAGLMREAGFPEGTFQTVLVDHERIPTIIKDDRIHAVTLTGSERAGRAVGSQAGAALKKSVLELGGSDAYVVLADADIEHAAEVCVTARLTNSGQSCVAAKRFIIDEKIYDAFAKAFVDCARKHVVGDPMDPMTTVGPLAKKSIRDDVAKQVDSSVTKGARLLLGGSLPSGPGNFYPITVLGDVKPGMPAFDEEVFGPAAALIRAKNTDDAIRLANLSRFGLGGAIFSKDAAKAERLAHKEMQAGFVAVNGMVQSDARLPFGGVKASGYGRELSLVGLREFVNTKTIQIFSNS